MSEAVKKGLIWGLGITALGVGIYLLYKKFGKTEDEGVYVPYAIGKYDKKINKC